MYNTDKEKGTKLLIEAVDAARNNLAVAVEIADEYGLCFTIAGQRYVGTRGGTRLTVNDYWDGVNYYDMEEDDPRYDPEEEYSGWQNSSTFC